VVFELLGWSASIGKIPYTLAVPVGKLDGGLVGIYPNGRSQIWEEDDLFQRLTDEQLAGLQGFDPYTERLYVFGDVSLLTRYPIEKEKAVFARLLNDPNFPKASIEMRVYLEDFG
jgi:hypothetical protein